VKAALTALVRDCEAPLDQLEQAHEQAAQKLTAYGGLDQQLRAQHEALRSESLSTDGFQGDWAAAAQLVEQAKTALPADPLAAVRQLDDAGARMSRLIEKSGKILEYARSAREASQQIEAVADLARQRRSQGFLLREAEADPDPLLADAQQQLAAAWRLMNAADDAAAGIAVSQAASLVQKAQKAIAEHVAARAQCERELPLCDGENRRLAELAASAQQQRHELERDFAPPSWAAVAENAVHAQGFLAAARQLTEQAAQHAAPHVQNYLPARRLLEQVRRQQQQAEQSLAAVGQRLHELVKLRGECQAQLNQILIQADGVARLLRSSHADRMPANERFRSASVRLERLAQESRMPRPDWTGLASQLREIEGDLRRAERLAREDAQLAEQAAAEIAETESVVGQARAYSVEGVRSDVSGADAQLAQARIRLAAQEYEEAIRLANAAEQAARDAWNTAQLRARQRQAEMQLQRQAEEAARTAAFSSQPPEVLAEAEEPNVRQRQMI
jgi:hypothetical protein